MPARDSFTSGMEATRANMVRLGGCCWGVVESGVAEGEVSVEDIVRGDGDGQEEREEDRVRLWRGQESQPFYYWVQL